MRPRKPIDNGKNLGIESDTPAAIGGAEFPVIHGPMRAAPVWHGRCGRSVTGRVESFVIWLICHHHMCTKNASRFEALLWHQFGPATRNKGAAWR